jgi:hypothetical protein
MKENDEKLTRVITSRDEIILMMMRLTIDVLEDPEKFKTLQGKAVTEFYEGENHRRNLEDREIAYLDLLRSSGVITELNLHLL